MNSYIFPGISYGIRKMPHEEQKKAVIEAVCAAYDVEFATIDTNSRKREIKDVRQVIMYIMAKYTSVTLMDIGKMFKDKFHHSTVIHNRDFISDMIETEDSTKKKVETILVRLGLKF